MSAYEWAMVILVCALVCFFAGVVPALMLRQQFKADQERSRVEWDALRPHWEQIARDNEARKLQRKREIDQIFAKVYQEIEESKDKQDAP